ncbi:MAG: DUF349 domain-containing protein [Lutibacter sp.]|uniref:DUF349 domain-containing protein n=1 Tax=Lutibacter sp. TaxID=1925666 RepID=UPI0019E30E42|nr:DUF349 domain-containing protein [Lutibacter sp.]NOR28231.1 DUF349 domain-containing protein [Lutibacter sp.]
MLDESKIVPSEEKSDLTPQTSEISEKNKQTNLTPENSSPSNTDESNIDEEKLLEVNKKSELTLETSQETIDKTVEGLSEKEKPSSDVAIDEIENKIAETSENIDYDTVELVDYEKLSLEELVGKLSKLVKEHPVQSIHNNVNNIKNTFNVKFGELLKKEKAAFLEAGGDVVDFKYENPIKSNYNSILYDYKIKKTEFYAKQDSQLNDNLQNKLSLIEDLKHLIDNADGTTMYKVFKGIQDRWKEIGPIPRAKYNDTWRTYHHHVERFYDLLHLNNDLRDLDFKHNYEEKLSLVVKAEELAELEDINFAFNELQILHKLWKEDVGPVGREHREEVWDRFSAATKKVHDKRHDFFKDLRSKFDENVDKKLAVIEAIEVIDTSKNASRSDWQKSIKELESLRTKFFDIGQVPRVKNKEIWDKFKGATKKFNNDKNIFFKDIKKDYLENLKAKQALLEQAIALKESEDWDSATDVMKKIQNDWKKIGHVPRKYSDKLWKEFKDACNHYFDRLHSEQDAGNKVELEVYNNKREFLNTIKAEVEDSTNITLDKLKEYINSWRDMGRVPFEKKYIEAKFNKLIDKITNASSIDKVEIEMIKFENLVNGYLEQKNYHKLNGEQLFVRKKVDETVREIQQLENNIGFISNASADNPLLKNVMDNINDYNVKLKIWKTKLAYLVKLDY